MRDGNVDLCTENPGFDVDWYINSKLRDLIEIWEGEIPIKTALGDKRIRTQGNRQLAKTMPDWLGISLFSDIRRGDPAQTRIAVE